MGIIQRKISCFNSILRMGREYHGVKTQGKRTFNKNLLQEGNSGVKDSRASIFCFGDSKKLQTKSHAKCAAFLYMHFLFGTYFPLQICSRIIKQNKTNKKKVCVFFYRNSNKRSWIVMMTVLWKVQSFFPSRFWGKWIISPVENK